VKGEWKSDRNTRELNFKRVLGSDKIRRISIRGGNE
jgi:hypothetical protein